MTGLRLSVLIRLELSCPGIIFSENVYNTMITIHGLVIIFFVVMPLLSGSFGNVLIPVMIGSKDILYPRLNSLSFWLLPLGFILIISRSLIESGSGTR